MTIKLPALQFYPGDWRKDPGVQALTYEERGIWIEMLFLMHESDQRGKLMLNGKPISEERLAQLMHLDKQKITSTISTLLELGVASACEETGALMNRRMVRDERIINKRRQAGLLGGNPAFEKGKDNPYYKQTDKQIDNLPDKQKITPSSSSSSSEEIQQRAKRTPETQGARLPEDFSVTPDFREWARDHAPHVDVDTALEEFHDFWKGVPGAKGRKLDWPATFRNRVRELEGRKNGRAAQPSHPNAYVKGKMII